MYYLYRKCCNKKNALATDSTHNYKWPRPLTCAHILDTDYCLITEHEYSGLTHCSQNSSWTPLQVVKRCSCVSSPSVPPSLWLYSFTLRSERLDLLTSVAEASRFYHGKRLRDSHAIAQCLNKRVCLIQLSARGCAKPLHCRCDSSNEPGLWAVLLVGREVV